MLGGNTEHGKGLAVVPERVRDHGENQPKTRLKIVSTCL